MSDKYPVDQNCDFNGDGENTSKTEDDITLEKPEKNNTAVYIIIAVCAVALIGGIVSFVVIKKKRK